MNCLKCGKKTADPHVFCEECQTIMDADPVKPGTPVHLPHRAEPQDKKARYRAPSPAETVSSLKRLIRWLVVTIAVMTVIICMMAGVIYRTISEQASADLIGKNYTTDTSVTTQP